MGDQGLCFRPIHAVHLSPDQFCRNRSVRESGAGAAAQILVRIVYGFHSQDRTNVIQLVRVYRIIGLHDVCRACVMASGMGRDTQFQRMCDQPGQPVQSYLLIKPLLDMKDVCDSLVFPAQRFQDLIDFFFFLRIFEHVPGQPECFETS